jgi:hypothetical protein
LQKDQRNGIIKETKTFPYRFEVECEEVMPNAFATAKVKARSFKTDVSVDADAGESTVTLSANLEFETEAFIEDVVKIATDAFSTEQEIELVKRDLECYKSCEVKKYSAIVKGVAPTDELPIGASILAVGVERVQVTKVEKEDNKIIIYPSTLIGATVYAQDLRAGFSLIVAAVNADSYTTIENAEVIFRGYEHLIEKLKNININVKIIK